MDDLIFVLMMCWTIPLALIGIVKVIDVFYSTFQVSKGFVRVYYIRPNKRGAIYWARPADKKITIENRSYEFKDGPDYLVLYSTFFGYIPSIAIDSKSAQQIKWLSAEKGAADPQAVDGLVKMSFKAGVQYGMGLAQDFKKYFWILGIVMVLGFAAVKLVK